MRAHLYTTLFVILAATVGCSESVLVRSIPPGAKVYWGDRLVGTTPTVFRVTRSEWRDDFDLRLERDGYEAASVIVPTHRTTLPVSSAIGTVRQ